MAAYEVLLLNTAIPQIQAAQSGDTYVVPRDIAFSTVASFAAGAEATPSIVATGDTNTGIWFPAADTVAISTGGISRLRLDSSGNLGLGVTPSAWYTGYTAQNIGYSGAIWSNRTSSDTNTVMVGLNSYLNSGATNWIYQNNGNASRYAQVSGQHLWYYAASGTADGTAATSLTSAQNGNSYTIKVAGTTDFTLIGAANNNVGTVFTKSGGTGAGTGTVSQNISFTQAMTLSSDGTFRVKGAGVAGSTDAVQFSGSAPASAMTLDSSGNLLVGTTSASGILASSGRGYIEVNGTTDSAIGFESNNTLGGYLYNSATEFRVANYSNNPLTFHTNNTERARITSGGNFYVGFTSGPTAAGSFYSTGTSVIAAIDGDAASADIMYAGYSDSTTTALGTLRFQVAANGNVTNSNGSYGTISDAKMKTDIVDAGSQWSDIKALRFRKFKMKDDPSGLVQLGVVAQEVEQTSPGLVDKHADKDAEGNDLGTTTKSVKTSVLLMKAAVALQEAMARIEKLEAEVAALKGA